MNAPRGWHSMITVNANSNLDARLFVFGGCFLIQPPPQSLPQSPPLIPHANFMQTAQPVTLTEYYTPRTNQWTIVKPMINLHKEASCSLSPIDSSLVYIYGGYNVRDKTTQKLISQYDWVKDAWSTVGQLSLGMTGVGACVLDLPPNTYVDHNESIDDDNDNQQQQLNELNLFRNHSNSSSDNDSSETKDDDDDEGLEWTTRNSSTTLPTMSDNEQLNTNNLRLMMKRLKIRKSNSSSNSFSSSSSSSTMSHLAGVEQK